MTGLDRERARAAIRQVLADEQVQFRMWTDESELLDRLVEAAASAVQADPRIDAVRDFLKNGPGAWDGDVYSSDLLDILKDPS